MYAIRSYYVINIYGKNIYSSKIPLKVNDIFIAVSDGAIHAGVGKTLNFGWERKEIIEYMEVFYDVGFTAKTLTTILLDKCFELYGGKPGDDTSVCTIRIRKREPMNLIIGPPANRDDCTKMMSLFFSKEGKHIVCGGTTSSIAAEYLSEKLRITSYNVCYTKLLRYLALKQCSFYSATVISSICT